MSDALFIAKISKKYEFVPARKNGPVLIFFSETKNPVFHMEFQQFLKFLLTAIRYLL
jgi:hypothetical protein